MNEEAAMNAFVEGMLKFSVKLVKAEPDELHGRGRGKVRSKAIRASPLCRSPTDSGDFFPLRHLRPSIIRGGGSRPTPCAGINIRH